MRTEEPPALAYRLAEGTKSSIRQPDGTPGKPRRPAIGCRRQPARSSVGVRVWCVPLADSGHIGQCGHSGRALAGVSGVAGVAEPPSETPRGRMHAP